MVLSTGPGIASLHERVEREFHASRQDVYAYLVTLGLGPAEAQEATQEVFLRLYMALKDGAVIENSRGWVFRVAHNYGLQVKAKQRPKAGLEALAKIASQSHPERQLLEKETASRMEQALQTLSPQQLQCLHLRAEGLRYSEIAEVLSISSSTVNEFVRRGIRKIRKVMNV